MSERKDFLEIWQRNTLQLIGYDLVASTVALGAAWLYGALGALAIVLVVIPILFLRHAYAVNYRLQATKRELLDLMAEILPPAEQGPLMLADAEHCCRELMREPRY